MPPNFASPLVHTDFFCAKINNNNLFDFLLLWLKSFEPFRYNVVKDLTDNIVLLNMRCRALINARSNLLANVAANQMPQHRMYDGYLQQLQQYAPTPQIEVNSITTAFNNDPQHLVLGGCQTMVDMIAGICLRTNNILRAMYLKFNHML